MNKLNSAIYNPQSEIHRPLWPLLSLGDLATNLFEIGIVIKGRALIFGVTVAAKAKRHLPFYATFFWMPPSFTMASFTLNPLQVEGDFLNRGILPNLPKTG